MKKILAFGVGLPAVDGLEVESLNSDRSFLDADIIAAEFTLDSFGVEYSATYAGLPILSEHSSFLFREARRKWKSEIRTALAAGRTIVIFLTQREQKYYYTGAQSLSGTGRSQKVTKTVDLCSNYDFLPVELPNATFNRGSTMRLADNAGPVGEYWSQLGASSEYNVYFDSVLGKPVVLTAVGGKAVGTLVKSQQGSGALLLLPVVIWTPEFLARYLSVDERKVAGRDTKVGSEAAQAKAIERFAHSFRDTLFRLDSALRGDASDIVSPAWAEESRYRLAEESTVEAHISNVGEGIDQLEHERAALLARLSELGALRMLLYGKGTPLELAVRDALRTLGYDVDHFKSGDSEFDALFLADGVRFIGEVEGKDSKAVSIEKASQLQRNIGEDLARDEVDEPAVGVLFGNAQRNLPPAEREATFTAKVLSYAKQANLVLVNTVDLFEVTLRLKNQPDDAFARRCRDAMRGGIGGVVIFPPE